MLQKMGGRKGKREEKKKKRQPVAGGTSRQLPTGWHFRGGKKRGKKFFGLEKIKKQKNKKIKIKIKIKNKK